MKNHHYTSELSINEIDSWLEKEVDEDGKVKFFDFNFFKFYQASRKQDSLILRNILFVAKGSVKTSNDSTSVTIRVRFNYGVSFAFAFIFIFLTLMLFSSNVTINENSSPSVFDKLGFYAIGILLFAPMLLILVSARGKFLSKLETSLKLNKTDPNTT